MDPMLREFMDPDGRQWRVWDVNPTLHARESPARPGHSIAVPDGWLCFESDDERRRLSPIPPAWETVDLPALEELRRSAQVVPSLELRRRRIPRQD